jgi:hypothetical protein
MAFDALAVHEMARGRHSPILTGDLVRAVETEASLVLCYWFGVTGQTVTKWRAAISVPHTTPGTSERKAAPRRGIPRPAHVKAALNRTGRPHTAALRAKMSDAQRKRGAWPPAAGRPWTEAEYHVVATLPPAEAAKKTGRSLSAVYYRRGKLNRQ